MLATTIRSLEIQVLDLRDLVKESAEIILRIATGKISIVGHPSGQVGGTVGGVTHTAFDRYKATQK